MTSRQRSQCSTCVHFRSPLDRVVRDPEAGAACDAFPDGIPDQVFGNEVDHRQPVAGDHGIRWESDGRDYPDLVEVPTP